MKKIKKTLALLCCAVLLVVISVGATIAYLTSSPDPVVNTFSVGDVIITLDEAPVDANGDAIAGERVKANSYKLLPNHVYDKDPTVHVDDNSEGCYVFVKIENQIADIEAATTIADQMADNGWKLVNDETNVYYYENVATAGEDIVVFETFKIRDNVTNTELADYAGKTVTVTAYAVQKDGFADANAAWTAGNNENKWVVKTPVDDTQGE